MAFDILILAKNPKKLEPAHLFLGRRGWPSKITNDLNWAITVLCSERPPFVFISHEFPHPARARVGQFIQETFQVEVIWFSEIVEEKTEVKSDRGENYLRGDPSGPNFERFLLRRLQDHSEYHKGVVIGERPILESQGQLIRKLEALAEEEMEARLKNVQFALKAILSRMGGYSERSADHVEVEENLYVIPIQEGEAQGYLTISTEGLAPEERTQVLGQFEALARRQFTVVQGFDLRTLTKSKPGLAMEARLRNFPFQVKFVPSESPFPRITPVRDTSMVKVSLSEISTDYPLSFKAYLHLEKNNRFLLYVKNGRRLMPEQKERLARNAFEDVCAKRIDETNLKRFLAFSHLEESARKTA